MYSHSLIVLPSCLQVAVSLVMPLWRTVRGAQAPTVPSSQLLTAQGPECERGFGCLQPPPAYLGR